MGIQKYRTASRLFSMLLGFFAVTSVFFSAVWFSYPLDAEQGQSGFFLSDTLSDTTHRTNMEAAILSDALLPQSDENLLVPRVVLDAGHGGEDGGAVSAGGMMEKNLNLSIVLMLGDMLEAAGIPVVYTRTEDAGLYDGALPGHRKMTDLKNRLAVWTQYPDAVFVSVHMNTFGASQYHGMQVFYSPHNERSALLAETIRENNRTYLQPDNTRVCKAADSAIYLLDRCTGTAVLAECGFLSNPEEAALLSDASYREKIAAILCMSILPYVCGGDADAAMP